MTASDTTGNSGGMLNIVTDSTLAGTTTINDGASLYGPAIVNAGALTFNRSDIYTADSLISGTGSLVKQGTGTLTLTG